MSARRDHITEVAALWFVRAQDPDFSRADREEFASWLAGSAENVLEFLALGAVSQDIREASANIDVDALLDLARESGDRNNVVAMLPSVSAGETKPLRPTKRLRHIAFLSTAASVLIASVAGIWLFSISGPASYSTGIGEQISFPLNDGSVVILNAQSSLEVNYTETERNVRLVAGEALFDVENDPNRPFQVRTERAMIRAAGTSFNVRNRGEHITVTVVEGIVDVESLNPAPEGGTPRPKSEDFGGLPADETAFTTQFRGKDGSIRLLAGQEARIQRQTAEITITSANVENATSWRERRLAFEARPLSEVVTEFNLFSNARIVIKDARLATMSISGAFDADDPESFALFLSEAGLAVAKQRSDGTFELRLRDEAL